MTGLTQMEFALAMMTAASLLLIARYWRLILFIILAMSVIAMFSVEDENPYD